MSDNLMGQSISQLRRWRRGQLVDHRQLNEPVDVLNDMTRGVGVPRQVLGQGRPAAVVGGATAQFKLTQSAADFPDHLVCRTWDGTTQGTEDVLVAKPWLLRKTPWDGETRGEVRYVYDLEDSTKRTAYDINDPPGTPEAERNKRNEMISPQYLIGDELVIAGMVTGIVVLGLDDEGLPIVVPVNLIDVTGARDWTVFYEQL